MSPDNKEKQKETIAEEHVKRATENARREIREASRRTLKILRRERTTRHRDLAASEK
ncbi:MAG: hypothetical protein RX318_11560 [bacterium]|nr:hypothetical protein [bacterium]